MDVVKNGVERDIRLGPGAPINNLNSTRLKAARANGNP
ncbi:hypothetical protein MNBD_ACTINO02-260, partial [hydrothermal vent metagenome]